MILVDTSGLLSVLDASQRYHRECASALTDAEPPLLLSPFVLAELDYLLMRHVDHSAQSGLLEEVARGVYQLETFDAEDVAHAKRVIERYPDLHVGLADASLAVLAERYDVVQILTLDERHFRTMRVGPRRRFKLLPLDQ